ncbi:class I SAM-dependent methyltransferase [Chloroflexota bacterium]
MTENIKCPSCGSTGISVFFELQGVPVNSVVLLKTREAALDYPTGDVRLGFCKDCGFIANVAFDQMLLEYSSRYEATQSFSPTFNAFARRLAARLIKEYDLHGKNIIEIGCGQGEFLTMLCELGGNRGVGFDPAYVGSRSKSEAADQITFVKDFYSEEYAAYHSDFVCCKMTLEHIQHTADFVSMIRRSLGDHSDTTVFFQVPDTTRILQELAFWDIYYEHCSYFSLGSLARLFRRCGFDVIRLAKEYDGQYLMVEARPGDGTGSLYLEQENDLKDLARDVAFFAENHQQKAEMWQHDLREVARHGRGAVLWGGGSKAVAFLTTLDFQEEITYVVDINPYKHGTYLAGTGQEVVPPGFLREYQPDVVVVMNPVYCAEIQQDLDRMDLGAKLIAV